MELRIVRTVAINTFTLHFGKSKEREKKSRRQISLMSMTTIAEKVLHAVRFFLSN